LILQDVGIEGREIALEKEVVGTINTFCIFNSLKSEFLSIIWVISD